MLFAKAGTSHRKHSDSRDGVAVIPSATRSCGIGGGMEHVKALPDLSAIWDLCAELLDFMHS